MRCTTRLTAAATRATGGIASARRALHASPAQSGKPHVGDLQRPGDGAVRTVTVLPGHG